MTKRVLGIDIGTTAIKVIVLDAISASRMEIVKTVSLGHDLISSFPGWAEENVGVWRANLYSILSSLSSEVDLSSLVAIGLTGMTPALVCLDSELNPIRNSIQQNDMRTSSEVDYLKNLLEKDGSYFAKTGSHVNSQHILPRLLWLRAHESENYRKIKHIIGSYDYGAFLLTGNLHIESNWALESGLFSLSGEFLDDVFALSRLDKSVLPPIALPNQVVGYVTDEASKKTGIPSGVPVYAGTADHVASAYCTGARGNGDLVLKLGGAGDILLSLDHLVLDDSLFIDYYCSKKCSYVLNGCTAASGSLIKWFRNEFGGDFKELDKEAESIPAGSDGIVILPYVLGEKTPIFDPDARGVIYGLLLSHTKAHIYRAMLESVAYAFRHHVDIFKKHNIEIRNVYITNGGSTSPLWRQIMADVLGCQVNYIRTNPGSCLGAAFIAGIANGVWTEDVISDFTKQREISYPDVANKESYDNAYYIYRQLYPRLFDLFHKNW